ncbi:MAG: hypothetical protein IJY12_01055 [Clostridia bacterium]|nr:hypothetical protein [Clostridia bacterium]
MQSPLITMSALTGRPSKEKIFTYLKGLKDNGIDQALVYPRSGCELEYLSEEWFDAIGNFIEAAQALDMSLWLYDDFNWPSGDAHGRVTKHEKFRLASITVKGENIGKICAKSLHNSGLFGEKYFPNLLSHEAVNCFMACTHEEYYKRFGKYFGSVIKGIFTDEPSIGYCSDDVSIPYYEGLEADYFAYCGRDFEKDMYSQYGDFPLLATEVVSNRFNECYIRKIADWCKAHSILMTGHLMCDDDPPGATRHGGHFLKNLSGFMLPGIDEISTDLSAENEMVLLGTAQYASGEHGAMAELFALGPCDMTYAKKRCMIYLAACHRINHYFLAISHVDMRGNMLVTDFFNNFNTDQPDFAGMRLLSEDAKKAAIYAGKDYVPDVYVRYPFSLCVKNAAGTMDLRCFAKLIRTLTYRQIQWKFADMEDDCGNVPVIELNENLEYTLDGQALPMDEICRRIRSEVTVTDANGAAPDGIFVRKFSDGNILVLNLFAPAGSYWIQGQCFLLEEHDVWIRGESTPEAPSPKKKALSLPFCVNYGDCNRIRTMYLNGQTTAVIECESDTAVYFAVRKDVSAYLNGQAIRCDREATLLSPGMCELYRLSDKISLEKGTSTLASEKDLKYMPSVCILGDFTTETENKPLNCVRLKKRARHFIPGDTLSDYGKIEFTADVTVPAGAKAIEICGTKLYTCLYANDIRLGEKIAAPYIYPIGQDCHGQKVQLKITQYSSMAPLFGDVDYWDKTAEHSQWRGTPSPKQTRFGFSEINWIF